ncbi:MAG: hypothetical protein LC115_13500 [Bacteroidia bacterium]|nr:hypothetical protein [Bacteroidia bacterium]
MAVLNSKFTGNFWTNNFSDLRTTFPKIKGSYLEKIPIPDIDFSNKEQKQKHDDIVKNIDLILQLNQELQQTNLSDKAEQLKHRIEYAECKINQIVYELYNLTTDEIKLIENK